MQGANFRRFTTLTNGEFDVHLGVARALRDVLAYEETYTFVYKGERDGHPVTREVTLFNAADDTAFYKSAVSGHGYYNDMFYWENLYVVVNGREYRIKFDAVTDLPVGTYGTAKVAMPECYTLGKVGFTVDEAPASFDTCRSFANFVLVDGVIHGPLIVDYTKSVAFKSKVTGEMQGRLAFCQGGAVVAASPTAVAASVAAIFPHNQGSSHHVYDGVLTQGAVGEDEIPLTPGTLGALVVLDAMANSGPGRPMSLAVDTVAHLSTLWPHDVAPLEEVDGTVNATVNENAYAVLSRDGVKMRSCPALEEFFTTVQRMDSDDPVMLILQTLHAGEQLSFVLNSEAPIYEPRGAGVSCWLHSLSYVLMVNLFDDVRYSMFHHVAAFFFLFASKYLRVTRRAHGDGYILNVKTADDGLVRTVAGNGSGAGLNRFDNAEFQGPANGDGSIWTSLAGDVGADGPFHLVAKGCTVFTRALGFADDFVVNAVYEEPVDVLKEKLFVTARPETVDGKVWGAGNHAVVCSLSGDGVFTVVYDPLRKLEGRTFTHGDRSGKRLASSAYEGALIAAPVRVNYNGSIVVMNGGDALTRDNFDVFGG